MSESRKVYEALALALVGGEIAAYSWTNSTFFYCQNVPTYTRTRHYLEIFRMLHVCPR